MNFGKNVPDNVLVILELVVTMIVCNLITMLEENRKDYILQKKFLDGKCKSLYSLSINSGIINLLLIQELVNVILSFYSFRDLIGKLFDPVFFLFVYKQRYIA